MPETLPQAETVIFHLNYRQIRLIQAALTYQAARINIQDCNDPPALMDGARQLFSAGTQFDWAFKQLGGAESAEALQETFCAAIERLRPNVQRTPEL